MADSKDLGSVQALFAAHKEELFRRFGAVGGGIGRNEKQYVITVYLRSKNDLPAEPVSIEGIQVRFEVTGDFHPHST